MTHQATFVHICIDDVLEPGARSKVAGQHAHTDDRGSDAVLDNDNDGSLRWLNVILSEQVFEHWELLRE